MSKANEFYLKGLEAENRGDTTKATQFFLASLKQDPAFVKSMRSLSAIYARAGKREESLALLEKAAQIQPSEDSFYNLAAEYYTINHLKKAIGYLKKALYMEKRHIESHLLLAFIYNKIGDADRTEIYLKNALRIDMSNRTALRELVLFYFNQSRFRDSYHLLEDYVYKYPEDQTLTQVRIDLLVKMGQYNNALKFLIEKTEDDPKYHVFIEAILSKSRSKLQFERMFFGKIIGLRDQKLEEFKVKYKEFTENEFAPPPSPQDALDISLMFLFSGESRKAMKFLIFTKQLIEEEKLP